jgi:hypothetical protein
MYNFWYECFQTEDRGGCNKVKTKRLLRSFIFLFIFLLILLMIFFIWKYFQNKKNGHLLPHRSPTTLLPYPNRIST